MGKTNMFRAETLVETFVTTVPASNTDYTIDIPAGSYHLALHAKSALTGTTTTVKLRPFMDNAQSQVGTLDLRMMEPDDTTTTAVLLAFAAGAKGTYAQIVAATGNNSANGYVIAVPHGLQATVTKGGATTAETFEVTLTATRVG